MFSSNVLKIARTDVTAHQYQFSGYFVSDTLCRMKYRPSLDGFYMHQWPGYDEWRNLQRNRDPRAFEMETQLRTFVVNRRRELEAKKKQILSKRGWRLMILRAKWTVAANRVLTQRKMEKNPVDLPF